MQYVVLQVVLKERFIGHSSRNLFELVAAKAFSAVTVFKRRWYLRKFKNEAP